MNKRSALILVLFGLSLACAPGASAATMTVNSNSDATAANGFCTLREAITNANNDTAQFPGAGECAAGSGGDTINFSAGFDGDADPTNRITLAADTPLPTLTQPVRISGGNCGTGASPKPCVQLDANGSGTDLTGETGFEVGADDVTISGIAITDADDLGTAAISSEDAT
jgi:CSLREA domain-containing protein